MTKLDNLPDDDVPDEMIAGPKEVGAIAHLYRAEVYRSTIWRERLDQTTSWAVVSTGIGLSISFATALASPFPIVLVTVLCVVYLVIEARRYRFFYVWRFRARVLELTFYVPMLRGEGASITDEHGTPLSDDYIKPKYRITMARAIGRRLRRIYAYVFGVLGAAFIAKLAIHPADATSFAEFVDRARIGPMPGWFALTVGTVFHVGWITFAFVTWRQDRGDNSKMEDFLDSDQAEVRMSDGG